MKSLITVYFLLLTILAYSQDMARLEHDLLAKYRRIDHWRSYSSDDAKIDTIDSLEKANNSFQKALIKIASTYPASLRYNFKSLQDSGLLIATSDDHRFRIYSWDSEEGGTMHIFFTVYQWLGEQGVNAKASNSEEGGDPGVFCTPIYTLRTPSKTYFLVVNHAIFSNKDSYQGIQAFCINKRSLNDSVRLFKTLTGLKNSISFEYDFFSVVNRPERPIQLISFDSVHKIISIPIVLENGTVTNRSIQYHWVGNYFERRK